MQRLLLATTAAVALAAPAMAADMPVKARPAPVEVVYNWTGFYIGGQVGVQWTRDEFSDPDRLGGPVGPNAFDFPGLIAGAHAGFNYQTGNFVLGIEGDIEWADASGSGTGTLAGGAPFVTGTAKLKSQASIRGRLGFAMNRTLAYVTGGAAFGRFDLGYIFPIGSVLLDPLNTTRTGWTVGAGLEHAFVGNWSGRIEYRFTDFGSVDGSIVNCCAPPPSAQHHELQAHAFRAGLTYRFGAPVVARY